ncbi:hypothetical protein H8356DRAFT_1359836 [Neocallimastix lanati (nom. inval.)]|nr:hypothetical protein H8356DRAFT_1359836 [Neocallimastix sp. JGI-2020a]
MRGSNNLYYKKNITKNMIKLDSISQYLIYDNLSEEYKNKFDFQKPCIIQICNIFKSSNTRSNEERKIQFKTNFENTKQNIDGQILQQKEIEIINKSTNGLIIRNMISSQMQKRVNFIIKPITRQRKVIEIIYIDELSSPDSSLY